MECYHSIFTNHYKPGIWNYTTGELLRTDCIIIDDRNGYIVSSYGK